MPTAADSTVLQQTLTLSESSADRTYNYSNSAM
jgi:hypothetical protein